MLKRTFVILPVVIALGIAAGVLAFTFSPGVGAGGRTGPGLAVHPGLVGQTMVPAAPPKAVSAAHGAIVDPDTLVRRIESGAGNNVKKGSADADLHTAGEIRDLRGRYASDYPIWVITVHGDFSLEASMPPGAHVPPLTKELIFVDAYTGEAVGRVLTTDTFAPKTPGAGLAVTPDAGDATAAAQ